MYITKVLNNSLLLAKDDNDEEIILMGKGIGHNYKAGSELNKKDIEKILFFMMKI
ncbi:CAT RNA binding domain-containing protein [Clostridioides difficile]|uniref:CAT RNA binding domain-containing protein n=1 Tax=Clostridioides difficile TaxID=1496 RepID=UPI00355BA406